MKLRCHTAHAESAAPGDPAGSPACRGWRNKSAECWSISLVLRAVAAGLDAESMRVEGWKKKSCQNKATAATQDCYKSYCNSALDRFGAPVGSKSKATHPGRCLFAAGCRYRDRLMGFRERSDAQERRQKLRIGQNKATGSPRSFSLTGL
jgi:hypothetical protein